MPPQRATGCQIRTIPAFRLPDHSLFATPLDDRFRADSRAHRSRAPRDVELLRETRGRRLAVRLVALGAIILNSAVEIRFT